jgi:hypothetical protein
MDLNTLREYINIHIISLEQDLEDAKEGVDIPDEEYFGSDDYYQGAIEACEHILGVIDER